MLAAFPQSPDPGAQLSFPSWRWRLDFLFVRLPSQWGASYRVIDEDRYGSDHRPIVGRIELVGDTP
jgi:endonuclease/exonuclease/phosphatase (EEP) superfamily protein YafD